MIAPACTSAADMQTTRGMTARRRRGSLLVLAMSGVEEHNSTEIDNWNSYKSEFRNSQISEFGQNFEIMLEILQNLEFWLEIPAGTSAPGRIQAQ